MIALLPLATDGRMLTGSGTGVAAYARELTRAQAFLTKETSILVDKQDREGDRPIAKPRVFRWMSAVTPGARQAHADEDGRYVARDIFRVAQTYFDIHGRLLKIRFPGPTGIMHWSYPVPLRIVGWRNLYTIHDAIPLLQPKLSPIDEHRHRRLLNRVVQAATRLVTVSETARNDIAQALGLDPERIVNCGEAVEPDMSSAALPRGLTPGSYLLAIGSVERRKNIEGICEAHRRSGIALPLVIAGPDGWGAGDLASHFASGRVRRIPYLERDTAVALIANATALLMPSLAEGFGLPVVEAMAVGTPVITSEKGALAEVADCAALFVDPEDIDAISAAIGRICSEVDLRRRLIDAGFGNARRFTRMRFAAALAQLYRDVAASAQ